ncbi:unnamed protein product [Phyllotreta striolata]|uniref:Lysosomal Pro-X carboxypeptidase n=1 Tax=Phyllotreta striolata TaxID=444603 RepID=A0A9N9TMT4_PHYSR|nr:unnamed protein product [Phyllotreta striolata]
MLRFIFYTTVVYCSLDFVLQSVSSEEFFDVETRYIDVPLTHNEWHTTINTFKLRYLINVKHYTNEGPLFIYLGSAGDINVFAQNSGFLFDIAKIFQAALVFVEHRYYGKSIPFLNESITTDNIRYLTSTETLADFAYVINMLKIDFFKSIYAFDTAPIIAFGDGYGGTLAAWLRIKYPHLVLGAISSSAPMHFSSDIENCECFYEVVTRAFEKYGGEQCVKTIKLGWDVIINLTRSKLGLDFISNTWKLCRPLRTAEEVNKLLVWLSNIYVKLTLRNYHYPTDFFTPLPAYPIKVFCDKLTTSYINDTKGLIEYYGQALEIYTNYSRNKMCNEFEDVTDYVHKYQLCTELVMPKCSIESDMFINKPWNFQNYSRECKAIFGVTTSYRDWTSLAYGGKNLKYFTNLVFSQAEMDPYRCYGIVDNVSESISSMQIMDGIHRIDFRNPDIADNNYIIYARRKMIEIIKSWIN